MAVVLSVSQPLMASLATPETLVINNAGPARGAVRVRITVPSQGYAILAPGDLQIERRVAASASWANVPVAENGSHQLTASYTTAIAAGVSRQQLTFDGTFPVPRRGNLTVPVTVTVTSASGSRLASQHTKFRVAGLELRLVSAPKSISPGGQPGELDFALTNPSGLAYPHIYLGLNPAGLSGVHTLDWFDGTAWKPLVIAGSINSPYGVLIRSGPVAPGTTTIRLRFGVSAGQSSRALSIQLNAMLPMPPGAQGLASQVNYVDATVPFS
jgi:hypothetical protein